MGISDTNTINNLSELSYNFPMYTIGEAATATILEDSKNNWEFNFFSKPEYADLCTIPIDGYETFLPPNDKIGLNGPGKFVSFGKELFDQAGPLSKKLLNKTYDSFDDVKLFIPHAASKKAYVDLLSELGIEKEKIFTKVYEDYGNLVSSSVPVGLSLAIEEKLITSGDNVSLIPTSAGLSGAVVKIIL